MNELKFKAVRSSGAGGQHVNKVSSKVMLFFDLMQSSGLNDDEKDLLTKRLKSKLSNNHELILSCDEYRSQHKNKEKVIERLFETLLKGLQVKKLRKPTKPSKSSITKRLEEKSKRSSKKDYRKKPKIE